MLQAHIDFLPLAMKPRAVAILVCSGCSLAAAAIGAAALVVVLRKARGRRRLEEARSKWAKAGENVVVLHQFPRAAIRNCLSASPFAVKLETFLRMANIKYVTDTDFPLSPATGTGPWITINSEEISDSQLVLEALTRKFGNDVRYVYSLSLSLVQYLCVLYIWPSLQLSFSSQRALRC